MKTLTSTERPATVATTLEAAWRIEWRRAEEARDAGDESAEWAHLERAHILSQPRAGLHLRTHVLMLRSAARRGDARELAGQLARLVLAAPGSLSGRYPIGNTGGADVSAFRPMSVPGDLEPFLTGEARS